MPQGLAEAKGTTPPQQQTGVERKLVRESSRGEGKEEKRDANAGASRNADSKETCGGRKLGSLCKQPTSPLLSEASQTMTFSSLPSRSADSGKLAPLDMGQRSPRSNASPRPSLLSTSPRELRDHSPERASFSQAQSGSSSPRSVSPRLPPMKSAPSPSMDDSSLPGLGPGLSPRKGAQSARRVRSLSPNIQRASITDRASLGSVRPQSRGGASGGGGGGSSSTGGRFSPLLDAKERGYRRGDSDPAVNGGVSSSNEGRRREAGRGGELGGGRGGRAGEPPNRSGEVAEAKIGATRDGPARLPGTMSTSPSRQRGETTRCSSSGKLPDTPLSSTSTNDRFERRNRLSRGELAPATSGDVLAAGDGRSDGHRQHNHHREAKDCSSTPSIPSIGRGEESSRSPRTRRMRPQVDSTA